MARQRTATETVLALNRRAIEQALEASTDAGSMAAFYKVVRMRNPSRSYFVRHADQLHSLKAVVAYALQQQRSSLTSRDFHAADAAKRLRELRFDVIHNVGDKDDKREREWLSRLARRGQAAFRAKLIDLYGRCPLSRCTTLAALEAAHVRQVSGGGADRPSNGILLRADLHKLFDGNLIAIDPKNGEVAVSASCGSEYRKLLARAVFRAPAGGPKLGDFKERWAQFEAKWPVRAAQKC